MINAEYYRMDRDYYLTEILFLLGKKRTFLSGQNIPGGEYTSLYFTKSPLTIQACQSGHPRGWQKKKNPQNSFLTTKYRYEWFLYNFSVSAAVLFRKFCQRKADRKSRFVKVQVKSPCDNTRTATCCKHSLMVKLM